MELKTNLLNVNRLMKIRRFIIYKLFKGGFVYGKQSASSIT